MRWNDRFIPGLAKSTPVRSIVVDAAEEIAAAARADAPVDTGAYRDGIRVEVDETPHRVLVRVVASDEKSMIVESRTGNLARALQRSAYG